MRTKVWCALLLLASSFALGQGKMQISTSKRTYAYGEPIEIRMRVWNDSTSSFVLTLPSGSFPYWLLDSVTFGYWVGFSDQTFLFNPGDSKSWIWRIQPSELGLPNLEGSHLVTGLCGKFLDTVTFEAPMYRGGPIGVELYRTVPPEDIARMRDSLNATLLQSWSDSSVVHERWQVEGYQIDSLVVALAGDPRVSNSWVSRPFPFVSDFIESGVPIGGLLPDGPRLHQNYPNPFNPSTIIEFELPKSSIVRLSVYDMLGREVSVLLNERREAGVHEVRFDGSNLASGVYFYRLTAGDFLQTRRLLLLR